MNADSDPHVLLGRLVDAATELAHIAMRKERSTKEALERIRLLESAIRYIVESENDHVIRMGHINAAKDLLNG